MLNIFKKLGFIVAIAVVGCSSSNFAGSKGSNGTAKSRATTSAPESIGTIDTARLPVNIVILDVGVGNFLQGQDDGASSPYRVRVGKLSETLNSKFIANEIWLTGSDKDAFFSSRQTLVSPDYTGVLSLSSLALSICPAETSGMISTKVISGANGPFEVIDKFKVCDKVFSNSTNIVFLFTTFRYPAQAPLDKQRGALLARLDPKLPVIFLLLRSVKSSFATGDDLLDVTEPYLKSKGIKPIVIGLTDKNNRSCPLSPNVKIEPDTSLDVAAPKTDGAIIDICDEDWDVQVNKAIREALKARARREM